MNGNLQHASKIFHIELLPALHGDCIWVEYGEPPATRHVLIDGGPLGAFGALKARVCELAQPRQIELFVVTHIDADHIEGAVKLLNHGELGLQFQDIWFNGWEQLRQRLSPSSATVSADDERGPRQGQYLAVRLEGRKEAWNRWFYGRAVIVPDDGLLPRIELDGGLALTLLSPNFARLKALRKTWLRSLDALHVKPEDTEFFRARLEAEERYRGEATVPAAPDSIAQAVAVEVALDSAVANGSSIAFIAEYQDKRCAFLADAHMQIIEPALARLARERGIGRLPLDAVKVSHHGSAGNVTPEFLAAIDCRRFLISTNGSQFDHPDDAAIECILASVPGARLYFNYRSARNEQWDDEERKRVRGYSAVYPAPGAAGVSVDLFDDDLPPLVHHQHR